ncbi:ABC transporter ATP-binding protein [Actinoplanes sp. TRM 88003]|uniref:ABC transporter ATP-binding protein n=1 Tax=Paractinoplanes aksuensis TaxID=2939490 RepID=A0ABT1DMG0_9ACTN|nr:ABC transporter ATP-binding protein [Actinoplanes aksuensis]MCO8271980.1 ABC transporter ATP-binding protein [Actinoplanes aksuensis]
MIEMRGVTIRYGDTVAVDDVSLTLPTDKIYGLLGRNGSGKTSLLSALASYRRPSRGTVLVDGVEAFENPAIMRGTAFIRDTLDLNDSDRVRAALDVAGRLRPTWDAEYAHKLLDIFELDPRKRISALSRGQRSIVGVVLGLAARTPLTILDESYLGMDAVARTLFYRELLADYLAHPRTIIISTHLIEEVAELFERVVIMDRGRVLLHDETDALRGRGVTVTGPAEQVSAFATGHTVLGEQTLVGVRALTLDGRLDPDEIARGERAGLTFGPLGLQDLFVHLTSQRLEVSR